MLSCPAYDGAPGTGKQLSSVAADTPCRVQLGTGALPEGLEAALCSMSKGEKSLFVIPSADMQPPTASSSSNKQPAALRLPALPAKCVQVEAVVELLDLVQVWSHDPLFVWVVSLPSWVQLRNSRLRSTCNTLLRRRYGRSNMDARPAAC